MCLGVRRSGLRSGSLSGSGSGSGTGTGSGTGGGSRRCSRSRLSARWGRLGCCSRRRWCRGMGWGRCGRRRGRIRDRGTVSEPPLDRKLALGG